MEFEEGNMVEVWRSEELAFGSWWTAKIISKYGRTYCVRYEKLINKDGNRIVDAVSYEDLRPLCNPLGDGESMMAGNMVEISDPLCWRVGEIVEILSRGWCVVRFGSSDKGTKIHKINIHMQQMWDGSKWVSIGKDGGMKNSDGRVIWTGETCSSRVNFGSRKCYMNEEGTGYNYVRDIVDPFMDSKIIQTSPSESCPGEANGGAFRKRKNRKTNEKVGVCEGPGSTLSPTLLNKVDAVCFLKPVVDEKRFHTFTRGETFGSYITDVAREELNGHTSSSFMRHVNVTEESTGSSVASCSSTNTPLYTYKKCRTSIMKPLEKNNDDDAESTSESQFGKILKLPQEEIAENVHTMELLAYHSTLLAFYASGPLNWEQEAILTDLRLSLNISNDEHLFQLRNVVASHSL